MKKKILLLSSILFVVFLIIAIVSFVLMNNAKHNETNVDPEIYDNGELVESINFLKFTTYEELKQYADNNPLYIQASENSDFFAIGEFYIKEAPVKLIYKLNSDRTLNRFDGKVSIKIDKESKDEVWDIVSEFNRVVVDYFGVETFEHAIFDEKGAPIDAYEENSYELMLNGKAKYNLTIIDESNTYWKISAVVTDKKKIEFEFFRCFDLSVYNDDSPNIDLRELEETGE